MNTTDHTPSTSTDHTPSTSSRLSHIARTCALAVLVVAAGVGLQLLVPGHAFAQQGDPFAGAEDGFIAILNRLKFWVWGVSAFGFALYLILYFGQTLWPSLYGSMRDYLRTGALLLVVFNVVFTFLVTQATNAKGASGGIITFAPTLLSHLIR